MKILFTGAGSFTGLWFTRELARDGHELVMIFTCDANEYEGLHRERVERAARLGRPIYDCRFGDGRFMGIVEEEGDWDMLCHHAAETTNYRSADFDAAAATHRNTMNLRTVLEKLSERGCRRVLLTGSVFEGGEGAGSEGLPSFSPYGLSKMLTAGMFGYYTRACGMNLGKFVIPNPFGPYEEPRFTDYLVRTWAEGKTPCVKTPDYVRDNIHVSLLAKAYRSFAESLSTSAAGFMKFNPSGYVECQGAFAERFARYLRPRLGLECGLEFATQREFTEPRIRINTDPLNAVQLEWDEARAWDELAEYYRGRFDIR